MIRGEFMDYKQSDQNLKNGLECQSCTFERAICLQEGKCLLELQEAYIKAIED